MSQEGWMRICGMIERCIKPYLVGVLGVDEKRLRQLNEIINRTRPKTCQFLPMCEGGLHSDDVALRILLFQKYGARKIHDYDYRVEPDDYHWIFCYRLTPVTRKALLDMDRYNDVEMVKLEAIQILWPRWRKGERIGEAEVDEAVRRAVKINEVRNKLINTVKCPECGRFGWRISLFWKWEDENTYTVIKTFGCTHVMKETIKFGAEDSEEDYDQGTRI